MQEDESFSIPSDWESRRANERIPFPVLPLSVSPQPEITAEATIEVQEPKLKKPKKRSPLEVPDRIIGSIDIGPNESLQALYQGTSDALYQGTSDELIPRRVLDNDMEFNPAQGSRNIFPYEDLLEPPHKNKLPTQYEQYKPTGGGTRMDEYTPLSAPRFLKETMAPDGPSMQPIQEPLQSRMYVQQPWYEGQQTQSYQPPLYEFRPAPAYGPQPPYMQQIPFYGPHVQTRPHEPHLWYEGQSQPRFYDQQIPLHEQSHVQYAQNHLYMPPHEPPQQIPLNEVQGPQRGYQQLSPLQSPHQSFTQSPIRNSMDSTVQNSMDSTIQNPTHNPLPNSTHNPLPNTPQGRTVISLSGQVRSIPMQGPVYETGQPQPIYYICTPHGEYIPVVYPPHPN